MLGSKLQAELKGDVCISSSGSVNGKGKRKTSKKPSGAGRPKKAVKKKRDPENREERWASAKDDDERAALEDTFFESDVKARKEKAKKEKAQREADRKATEALEKEAKRKKTNAEFFGTKVRHLCKIWVEMQS